MDLTLFTVFLWFDFCFAFLLQGGFPYWLLKEKPNIHVRSSDPSKVLIM